MRFVCAAWSRPSNKTKSSRAVEFRVDGVLIEAIGRRASISLAAIGSIRQLSAFCRVWYSA